MRRYVFDAHAILAYAEGEKGAKEVALVLKKALDNEAEIYFSVVNWGESYYIALREGGEERAEVYRSTIEKYPIMIVEPNKELALQAARYKATHRISYADAFAAALAKLRKAELVTGDREFKPLDGEIRILWI